MINKLDLTMKEKLWVYGSLRYGEYNHVLLGQNSKYLGTGLVTGYKMYSLGLYPFVVKTDNPKDIITVEGYEIDIDRANIIKNMERDAGYKEQIVEIEVIEGGVILGNIFIQEKTLRYYDELVSGDWVKERANRYLGYYY